MDQFQIIFSLFLLGLLLGRFFHSLVWKLYAMEKLSSASRCPDCRQVLPTIDTLPLISYWLLGGECRYCKKPIGWQYPAIELLTACVFALIGPNAFALFVASILILVIASDARYKMIYDVIIIPAILIALVWHAAIGGGIISMILGALLGFGFFGAQYYLSGGELIGYGDVKLAVFLGLAFGWKALMFIIVLTYILGTVVSLVWLVRRQKTLKSTLPLGVFLGIASLYILVWGTGPLERLIQL